MSKTRSLARQLRRWLARSAAAAGLAAAAAVSADAAELVVGSAVSLREPVAEIAAGFERERRGAVVRAAFGASSALAAQLRAGAPIDVLLSADRRIVEALAADGLVDGRRSFPLARNGLVVIQPPDAPRLAGPEALAGDALRRVAVAPDAVPVGHYARAWLAQRGLLRPLAPRIVAAEHARAVLAAVDLGHADAGIVYATDARVARSAVVAFEIPADEQPEIVYVAAATREGDLADAFLAFLRSDAAREALSRAGFSPFVGPR